jgi:hypothetical protein
LQVTETTESENAGKMGLFQMHFLALKHKEARAWWHTPVALAAVEAKVGRIVVEKKLERPHLNQ